MGTVMPGPGGVATEDVSAVADVSSGDKVRELFTRKGVRIISPIVSQAAQGDAISTASLVGVLSERDSQVAANYAAWVYLFNGTTMDRLRGDTNGLQAQGPAASDAPELGNPVQIGGSVDNTAPVAAAEGDVRRIRTTPEGELLIAGLGASDAFDGVAAARLMVSVDDNQRALGMCAYGRAPDGLLDRQRTLGDVALDGLGQLCVAAAVPGAGIVQTFRRTVVNTSSRSTMLTPAAGNRIRIISITTIWDSTTASSVEVYFGFGTTIGTTATNAIFEAFLLSPETRYAQQSWPDGGGPVGLADEVVSVRAGTAVPGSTLGLVTSYREE